MTDNTTLREKVEAITSELRMSIFASQMTEEAAALLQTLMEELDKRDGWKPIETAPRTGEWFETYTPGSDCDAIDMAAWSDEYEEFIKRCCGWDQVTHWRLPSPPKDTAA